MSPEPAPAAPKHPAGITLLEVLISCGLLIMGLATMASLLPAAGTILTQATTEDRAAVLLSNATAEMCNRGLVAADAFVQAGSGTASVPRTLVFGKVLGRLPTSGLLPSGRNTAEYFAGPSAAGLRRSGSLRTFMLEDVMVYDTSQFTGTLVNTFSSDAGGTGPRAYRQGLCWGATLIPKQFPPLAGEPATLTIAVFKRESDAGSGSLEDGIPVVLTRNGSCYEADAVTGGPLLRGCSWVLAIPPTPSTSPAWFKITSSWTWDGGAGPTTRVIMRNQDSFATVTGAAAAGSTATVFAFDGIVRLDEQSVTLQ